MIFKEYSEIFGKPGESAHKMRMFGTQTAALDYILSILLAWIISALTQIPLVLVTITVLLFSVIIHYLFGVKTHAVKWLMSITTELFKSVLHHKCDPK
jgi:hypothetical protein